MRTNMVSGDEMIEVTLPDRTRMIQPSFTLPLQGVESLEGTIRDALSHPLNFRPLRESVKPGHRVAIAFDDPTVLCYAPVWEIALNLVVAELEKGGVARRDITLVCANALHRKFTRMELAKILGESLVKEFGYRLFCHDAEDEKSLTYLGLTPSGYEVEVNSLVADSDLTIYVNTNCFRGFNGGWKSVCVGLASYRSIRWHHTPDGMSMSLTHNPMHQIFDEMGNHLEAVLGKRIFKIETVLGNPLEVAYLWAGTVQATRQAALAVLKTHHQPRREMMEEKADIIVYGVPNWSPYAAFSFMNPILTLISTGLGYLGGMIEAIGKPGCTVVLSTPCPNQWDDIHHPSYREVWDAILTHTRDPYQIRDQYEEDFAHRPEYIYKYRYGYGFHPVHGIMATYPLKRLRHAGRVFVAGAREPSLVRHLGFEPMVGVEAAIAEAESLHGKDAVIAFINYPPAISRQ
ncbi:MAG: DUF2088 domain-containing protein [Acidobacteria bacterium]|nr:DUF2088 domain-containing protein [Acidobacteriota bacterium]MBI3657105.1 DUF2088 domain-containing protein [Acidobacteriota bacterium]